MPVNNDLKTAANVAQKLGLITPRQLARMTDGTVSWRDKAAAERAVAIAKESGNPGVGVVANVLQREVNAAYQQQNPLRTAAEAVAEGPAVVSQRIQDLAKKLR